MDEFFDSINRAGPLFTLLAALIAARIASSFGHIQADIARQQARTALGADTRCRDAVDIGRAGFGTDALAGLSGRMIIDIAADGTHAYGFGFTLPDGTP